MAGRYRVIRASLRGLARREPLFLILAVMIRFGALKRPGLILGSFIAIYVLLHVSSANSSASPTRSCEFCGVD